MPPLSPSDDKALEELKHTLFLVQGFHEALGRERELLTTLTGQLASSAAMLERQLQGQKRFLESVSTRLTQTLHTETQEMGRKVGQEAGEIFFQRSRLPLKALTESLERAVDQAQERLSYLSRWTLVWVGLAGLLAGLVGGGVVHMMAPSLSAELCHKVYWGEVMLKIWPRLSEKEKQRLSSLGVS